MSTNTTSPTSEGTNSVFPSGKRTDGTFRSSSTATNASPASPSGSNPPGGFDEGNNDRSPALSDEPAGERIPSFTSDIEDFAASRDPSLSSAPEDSCISIEPDVNPSLASTNGKDASKSPSALTDRRGKNPEPFCFSQPRVKAHAQSAQVAAEKNVVGSASSNLTVDVDMSETMVNVLTKLELLPAVIALRASARPGADPDEAHKAFEHAHKAHDFAERKGADVGLITQCKYYMALSNFATANPDQKRTLKLFKEARSAIGHGDEAEWAGSWVSYFEDHQYIKEEEQKAEEASSRPNSFLGQLINPLAAVLGSRPTSADSKVETAKRTSSRAGLFDQMAPLRRGFVPTKPAAKRMALSIDSKDFSPPPQKPPPRLPRHQREYFLPTFVSSQSTLPDDSPSNSMKARIRESRIARRDSQGNYEHLRTGLKYNEEHPFGLDVEFVTSPESYTPPSPPIPDPSSTWPASQSSKAESPQAGSPPPRKKYYIVNPDPSGKLSSSAGACASRSTRADSVAVEDTEEEVQQPKRNGSWMKRLSISRVQKLGSPTRSVEAMAEEGESPVFQPKGWGQLGEGLWKGGRKGTV